MNNENYKIANDLSLLCAIHPNDADLGKEIRLHYGKRKKYEKEIKKN